MERQAADAAGANRPSHQPESTPLFPANEADGFRSRWDAIQASFVDEPRKAVEQADSLVAEVIKRLAETFAGERNTLEEHWGRGEDIDTEDCGSRCGATAPSSTGCFRHNRPARRGAFDTRSRRVYGECCYRKRQLEPITLPGQLDAAIPRHITTVHLLCANVSIHHGRKVRRWLARHPSFVPHCTRSTAPG